jgi:ATP-binding cassette subfamily C protein CydD
MSNHNDGFIPAVTVDTLGEAASRLSVGQAQRIALARAIVRPAQLVLLDEPTASLDRASERWVDDGL